RQRALAVVNVSDGADVDVRLCALEGVLRHFPRPPPSCSNMLRDSRPVAGLIQAGRPSKRCCIVPIDQRIRFFTGPLTARRTPPDLSTMRIIAEFAFVLFPPQDRSAQSGSKRQSYASRMGLATPAG